MIRPLARTAAIVVAGPYLLLASALAPAHVHAASSGHDHAIAHSHFGAHTAEAHHTEQAEVEQADARIVWLDTSVLNEQSYVASPGPAAVASMIQTIPVRQQWSSIPTDRPAPAHGPPKAPYPFRGPPPSRL